MSQNLQPLSDYVTLESLPEELQFLNIAVAPLLNRLKVFDYDHQISTFSNSTTIQIVIRAEEKIGFEIPGTGLEITLNPNIDNLGVTYTDIPITINVKHHSQGSLSKLNPTIFSGQLDDIFQILNDYFNVGEVDSLSRLLRINYTDGNDLINEINMEFGSSISANLDTATLTTPESQSAEIINRVYADTTLNNQNVNVDEIVYRLQLNSGSQSSDIDNIKEYYKTELSVDSFFKYILNLIIPKFQATLDINAGISFPRNILRPYKNLGGGVFELETDTNVKTTLIFDPGDFYFNSDSGFGYDESYTVTFPPLYPKAEIGTTGLKISFTLARLDLSKKTNIPEASADGRPNDFTGVFIDEATIELPDKLTPGSGSNALLIGKNLLIGTGGLSGTIGMALKSSTTGNPDPFVEIPIGSSGMQLTVDTFSLTFQQNSIIASNITGTLTLPSQFVQGGSSATIAVQAAFANNGDFSLTASSSAGFEIEIPNVLTIKVYELSLVEVNDKFFIKINGALKISAAPAGFALMDDFVPVPGIIIWEDGSIEIEGGRIPIPNAFELKLGPTTISITAIDYGTAKRNDRNYSYFGFSGGLDMSPGGVDIQGNGIKYFYTTDGAPFDHFLELDQIGIDIHLPAHMDPSKAKVNINGFLSISNPQDNSGSANDESGNPSKEYMGSVAFLLRLKEGAEISGGAAMRLRPKEPSFVVDAFMEMNKPIPLGTTGLGIFGFRGLIGQRFVPSKSAANISENSTWWNYYKAPAEGVNVGKFGQKDGFSIGAGLALATSEDDGYATYGDIARLAIYT